jgi:hypothetical protein
MASDLVLRRKLTVRAHGRTLVLVKRPGEGAEHVLMKAVLWALYLPAYPALAVEVPVGDRYKPDLVAAGPDGRPAFWGEAGKVSAQKIRALARRFPDTHFAVAKWTTRLDPHAARVREALGEKPGTPPSSSSASRPTPPSGSWAPAARSRWSSATWRWCAWANAGANARRARPGGDGG